MAASDITRAAVRPGGGVLMQAQARGTLRADPATGCLWLELESGTTSPQLLLQGAAYWVDFSTNPPVIMYGDDIVATVGEVVEVGGGYSELVQGVAGCPATGGTFLGYFKHSR